MTILYALLAFLAGTGFTLQGPVNTALSKQTDRFFSAVVSLFGGAVITGLGALLFGAGSLKNLNTVQFWQLLGGFYAAYNVFMAMVGIPRLGVALHVTTLLFGQLSMAMVIDTYGLFRITPTPVSLLRLAGIAFVGLGILLMYKSNKRTETQARQKRNVWVMLLVFLVGVSISVQLPTNASLAVRIGKLESTFVSMTVGFLLSLIPFFVVAFRKVGKRPLKDTKPWMYTGGLFGGVSLFLNILATPVLGVTLLSACGMLGRLSVGMLNDALGLFGLKKKKVTMLQLAGVLAVACGVCLVTWAKLRG